MTLRAVPRSTYTAAEIAAWQQDQARRTDDMLWGLPLLILGALAVMLGSLLAHRALLPPQCPVWALSAVLSAWARR